MSSHTDSADQLNRLTKAGDLAGAYVLLRALPRQEAWTVSLVAGFSAVGFNRRKEAGAFWQHLQAQVAQAARLRATGYDLRNAKK